MKRGMLRSLADRLPEAAGRDLPTRLLAALCEALGFEEALVGTLTTEDPPRLLRRAAWGRRTVEGPTVLDLSGSPWEAVAAGSTVHLPEGVAEQFPEDSLVASGGFASLLGVPLRDGQGRPMGLLSLYAGRTTALSADETALVELTAAGISAELDRERAVEESRRCLDRFREMVDESEDMVCRFLPDGRLTYANRSFGRLIGMAPADALGKVYEPVVHPEDRDRVQRELETISPERPVIAIVNRVVFPTGAVRWVDWTNQAFFDEAGRPVEYQASGRDITDRVEAEQELRRSEARFRFLAEGSTLLAGSLELETTLSRVSRMAVPFLADSCTVTLLGEEGPQHVSASHVDPEMERFLSDQPMPDLETNPGLRELLSALDRGESILVPEFGGAELSSLRLDETMRRSALRQDPRSYMIVPLSARGRTLGALSFVSGRRYSNRCYGPDDLELAVELGRRAGLAVDNARLYREIQDADRRKDEFLATLAHELRNPIAATVHALEILGSPRAPEASRARALEIAARQTAHQTRLIDDLMDVSRLSRGKIELRLEPVRVDRALPEMARARRAAFEARRQELVVEVPDEPLVVQADPDRLEQIVGNLLDNAMRYTPENREIRLRARRTGDQIEISIRDQGVGIPPEVLPHVFDPFFQSRPGEDLMPGGLGIGLAIVRQLVQLHGGTVRAQSEGSGRGSEFVVRLPISRAVAETAPEAANEPAPRPPALSVLVADDNADAAETLALLLQSWDHPVRVVHGGREALAAFDQEPPDVALIDIAMPGLDGYETARALRSRPGGDASFLVALSGFGQPADVRRALDAGFDRHLTKPARIADLRRILSEAGSTTPHRQIR